MSKEFHVQDGRDDLPVFIHSRLDDYGLTPIEFRVYGRLARRAGAEGATESVRNMAAGCKVSERSVQLALKLLELAGLVRREDKPGLTTAYRLLPPAGWAHPSKLDALRRQVTAKWKKAAPATVAPVQPLHPRNRCAPTGATIAPKGTPSEGTPNTSSSPSAQKKPRARKDALPISRLSEPERAVIEAWREVTGRFPKEQVWSYILERLAPGFDAERLHRCGGAYIANYGTGPRHVAGICDWYAQDRVQPERSSGHAGNGRSQAGGGHDHAQAGGREPSRRDRNRAERLRQCEEVTFDASPTLQT